MTLRSSVDVTRKAVIAPNGVVAAGHQLAADAGISMLERGGNAADAAVAAAFAAGVVEPWNCGIGGHGFCAVYRAQSEETEILNWVTRAPDRATPDMYEIEEGHAGFFGWPRVKADAQETGYLAAEAPATGQALAALLARHGSMTLAEVLEPAIQLAVEGFPVDWRTSYLIANNLEAMRAMPPLAAIYAPSGFPPRAGTFYRPADRLVLGDLGRTLQRLAVEGPYVLTHGDLAQRVVSEVQARGGILTMGDLAAIASPLIEREPRWSYRGATYVTGVCPVIVLVLNILECFDLRSLGPDHPLYRHLMIEAMRQAWLDCFTYLGDPAFVDAPWKGLQSKEYARDRASAIDLRRAKRERRPGDPWRFEGRPRPRRSEHGPSVGNGGSDTTQVVAIDRSGNMVSLEESLGGSFGSKVAIPGTGIVLGNGMSAFDPRPGRTQSVAPGKRPWKIAPAILAFRDGRPWLSLCASGGRTTTAAALNVLVNLIDFEMSLQDAVEAPRVHSEFGRSYIDERASRSTQDALRAMGHDVESVREDAALAAFGRPSVALIDPATGVRMAGGDALHSAGAAGH